MDTIEDSHIYHLGASSWIWVQDISNILFLISIFEIFWWSYGSRIFQIWIWYSQLVMAISLSSQIDLVSFFLLVLKVRDHSLSFMSLVWASSLLEIRGYLVLMREDSFGMESCIKRGVLLSFKTTICQALVFISLVLDLFFFRDYHFGVGFFHCLMFSKCLKVLSWERKWEREGLGPCFQREE